MTITKGLLAAAISLASLTAAASANADSTVSFTLQDVRFDDGTFATGSFTTDDTRTSIVSFAIQTREGTFTSLIPNGGTVAAKGFIWNTSTANATLSTTGALFQQIGGGMYGRGLSLNFSPMTGGAVNVNGGEGAFINSRGIVSGQIVSPAVIGATGAVPEPATWAMMMLGFGAVGASLRTRRRTAKIAFA